MPIDESTIIVKTRSSRWRIAVVSLTLKLGLIGLAGWLWDLLKPQAIKVGRKPWREITWSQIVIEKPEP
jgi:hypothetical protein